LTDVLNGEITMTFAQLSNAKPFIDNGRLRALGVASKARSAALPDVPTIAEAGRLPGFEAVSWYALMAPAGTPDAVVRKLAGEVASIMHPIARALAGMPLPRIEIPHRLGRTASALRLAACWFAAPTPRPATQRRRQAPR
jgi:hypothetical protein